MTRVVTIADIAAPTPRAIAIGPFGSALRADRYTDSGVPVVRGQNIGERWGLSTEDVVYVARETAAEFPASVVRPGDLVFPHRGAIGRVALVDDQEWLLSSSMMKLTVNPELADPRFVLLYFRDKGRDELLSRASTVGTPGIGQPLSSLRSIPITLPTLAEQQAIAEVLGALDDKIAANTALSVAADEYASTLLLHSLSTERVRLSALAQITMGSSPKGEALNESGDGLPFYQGVRDFGLRSPARRVYTTAPVREAAAGDLLVSVRAPVGEVNVAQERVCIGRGIAAVRSLRGKQATLLHQLKAERDVWEPYEAEGTVFGSINRDQLHGIQLRVVESSVAERVEEELASIEHSISATLGENRTLAATRDVLLPQLMSGKLRIRDAARIASEVGT